MVYRDTVRDGRAGWQGSMVCGNRGLTTASPSSPSVGGVASFAVLASLDQYLGPCGVVNVVFYGFARCYRRRGLGREEREGKKCY